MQFVDLGRQYEKIGQDVEERVLKVLHNRHFIMGEEIRELEQRLAAFAGRKYCLTCGSGTEALQIPLMAEKLTKKDAVFVPAFTFFASAESISITGGTPVFVDVDRCFNMDPEDLERRIRQVLQEGKLVPRGIVPVDLFGRSADYDRILPIAKKYGLFVLEDAAQGFGGSLRGVRNGAFGDVSATSFFPAKPLGCYGDGGAIFTDSDELYETMHSIRVHGQGSDKYDNVRLGINGRMDTLQAAIVLAKLEVFEEELQNRQKVAGWYAERLEGRFEVPVTDEDHFSAWAQYTVLARDREERDRIVSEMKKKDIPVMVYYPIPLHQQTVYRNLGYGSEQLPYCEELCKRVFSLPMHPYLTEEEVDIVCGELSDCVS
ncbi:MAG: DegT/DnrJ/EryC1/StrS family aminotransferase [Eubacterium sp.]|nr:DegT/DnrJ/EryC1/StrS family aminotransferase [Eubacterium sp.]